MSTAEEIAQAVQKLPPDQFAAFREWFEEFAAEAWDRQIEDDARAGRLDRLADEALRDLDEGRTTEAPDE
jgi:hypothetical protein